MPHRPSELYSFFTPLSSLKGVGKAIEKSLDRYFRVEEDDSARVKDILWHLPRDIIIRHGVDNFHGVGNRSFVTVEVSVDGHAESPPRSNRPYKVNVTTKSGELLQLLWFKGDKRYFQRMLPVGETRIVSGRLEDSRGGYCIVHPDYVVPVGEVDSIPSVESIYGLGAGLTNKLFCKLASQSLGLCPDLPEWIDGDLLLRRGWLSWRESLILAHNVVGLESLLPSDKSRERLAYDELLAHQLGLLILREFMRRKSGQELRGDGLLRGKLLSSLPFSLTSSQERAYEEIVSDMGCGSMMMRLLQGDVGSGKTIVGLLAMLVAVENGGQSALMVPTELLASQHYGVIVDFLSDIGVRVCLLTGGVKGKARESLLSEIREGGVDIVIGTHALFQSDVIYRDLQLVVIDEQHRFGVEQRLALLSKGVSPDLLVMTATPIPRTLFMTCYGDLDSSRLVEKPQGFKAIHTSLIKLERSDELMVRLESLLLSGEQAYWVCPLVEGSEDLDVVAAEDRYRDLVSRLGSERVGMVHGRMKVADKDEVMRRFRAGDLRVIVATTVIEVGIDVSTANVMVIEQAERFGLAQLHQLRGRVGRSSSQSYCILLYDSGCSDIARSRLRVMRESDDGFVIAEKDLELRGVGEVLGVRQSGLPQFRLADMSVHGDLVDFSREQARLVIEKDYALKLPENHAYRLLLHIFEISSAMGYLHSG